MSTGQCIVSPRTVSNIFDFSSNSLHSTINKQHTPTNTLNKSIVSQSMNRPGADTTNLHVSSVTQSPFVRVVSTDSPRTEFDIQPVYNADVGQRRPSIVALSKPSSASQSHKPTSAYTDRTLSISLPGSTRPNLYLRTTTSPIDSISSLDNSSGINTPQCPIQPDTHHQRQSKLNYFANDCTELQPHLFVGGRNVANNLELLQSKGITHIVNCCGAVCDNIYTQHFTYCKLYLLDSSSEDILCILYPILAFIENAVSHHGKVLIHCHQGVSRSCVLCIAYIMYSINCDYDEAYSIVRQQRGICRPNVGFMVQLMSWRKRVTGTSNRPFCLYRIAPHCNHDRRVVAKWCDRIDVSSIDSRGTYVLTTNDTVIIWIGAQCQSNERIYMQRAMELIYTLQSIENVSQQVAIIHQADELVALQHVAPYNGRAFGISVDSPVHIRSTSLQLSDTQILDIVQPCNLPSTSRCYHPSCASTPSPYTGNKSNFLCFAQLSSYFWKIMGGSHMQLYHNSVYDTDYDSGQPINTQLIGGTSYVILTNKSNTIQSSLSESTHASTVSSPVPTTIPLAIHQSYDITINSPSTKRKQHLRRSTMNSIDEYVNHDTGTPCRLFTRTNHSRHGSLRLLSRRSSITDLSTDLVDDESTNLLRNKLMRITLNTDILGCGSPSINYRKRASGQHQSTTHPSSISYNGTGTTQYSHDNCDQLYATAWLYQVNESQFDRIEVYDESTLHNQHAYVLVARERGCNDVYIHIWIGSEYKPAVNDHRFRSSAPHQYDIDSTDIDENSIDCVDNESTVDIQSIAQAIGKQLVDKLRLDDMNNHVTVETIGNETAEFRHRLNYSIT